MLLRSPTLFSLLAIVLSSTHTANAKPFPKELKRELTTESDVELEPRQCANPCGWNGQLCCASNQYCYTDSNNQAQCGSNAPVPAAAANGGSWQLYTTTYIETGVITVTTTYSVLSPAATTPAVAGSGGITCSSNLNETPCGSICCASGQFCQYLGQCAAAGGGSSVNAPAPSENPSGSAFIRPTSGTIVTVTQTGSATATVAFQTAVGTDGSAALGTTVTTNNGLSAGAIAGIVIGVLAALFILLLICLCCCAKGILDGLLGIFGLGKKKTVIEETEIYEHRHSHHGGSQAPPQRRWFGMGGPKPARQDKKSSGLGGLLGVAGILGTLAIILGLKRKRDRRDEKSEYTASNSSYSYYTSESSASSDDRRTRDSRRTRDTRGSRR